jgi:hypothetical protein
MESVTTATESIEDFFARYTGYLTAGDIEGDFFTQGQDFYRSRGIQGVRAREIVTDVEVPGIWVGRLELENLDGSGAPVDLERNAYQLITAADGKRRIAVSTPLDAYTPRESGD